MEYSTKSTLEELDMPHGVNAIILNEKGEILLGQRVGNRAGSGLWSLIGGKQKVGETFEEAMQRELKEELGIDAKVEDMQVLNLANCIQSPSVHYLQIGILVKKWSGEIKNVEPQKCSQLKFFPLNKLPKAEEIFTSTRLNIELFLKNKFYDQNIIYTYKNKD